MTSLRMRKVLLGFLIIFFIVIIEKTVSVNVSSQNTSQKEHVLAATTGTGVAAQKPTVILSLSPIPTASPTLSPSPLPTPTHIPTPVYTGFCLNVPVLLYHHIMPWGIAREKGQTSLTVDNGAFDQQMGYIASHGFTTIFASDLVNALHNHTTLPSKSIVVTIDDGYEDNYTYAFPTIKKYNIKTSLMIPTGLLGANSGANNYFTWGELKEMVGSGLVEADDHTWSHYAMGSQGLTKDQFEVSTAQKQLLDNFGKQVIAFAYPYGTNALSAKEHTLLAQNGIIGAFSTIGGTYQCDSMLLNLHRTRIGTVPFPAFGIN